MDQILEINGISKVDLVNWQQLPITRVVEAAILAQIKQTLLHVGEGAVLDTGNPGSTAQNYSKAVGYIEGLRAALNLKADDDDQEDPEKEIDA